MALFRKSKKQVLLENLQLATAIFAVIGGFAEAAVAMKTLFTTTVKEETTTSKKTTTIGFH